MQKADLHIHTTASDGKHAPAEVVKKAASRGLSVIALTDHDTYSGYFEARAAGVDAGVHVIAGAEITSDYKGRECHLLAYGFDVGNKELKKLLLDQKFRRINRARKMVENLRKLGVIIEFEDVAKIALNVPISRNHIAGLLVEKKIVKNVKAAFDKYLSNEAPAYFKSEYHSIEDVISIISGAGGVSVLAHPGLLYVDDDLIYFSKTDLDGIETIHPSHNYDLQRKYEEFAKINGLLTTGGSDYHGFKDADDQYLGVVCVDAKKADRIESFCRERKENITS
ncbi:MAG: PHP domain-containing protein [Cyclonatronaceae bacterium]